MCFQVIHVGEGYLCMRPPDDYVSITSYTHHPFYQPFVVEVQDNWRWAQSYNLPLNEMMEVIDNAINNGYTIAWGADVSEKGFGAVTRVPLNDKEKDLSHKKYIPPIIKAWQ